MSNHVAFPPWLAVGREVFYLETSDDEETAQLQPIPATVVAHNRRAKTFSVELQTNGLQKEISTSQRDVYVTPLPLKVDDAGDTNVVNLYQYVPVEEYKNGLHNLAATLVREDEEGNTVIHVVKPGDVVAVNLKGPVNESYLQASGVRLDSPLDYWLAKSKDI
jgi:hypothetical protein